MRKYLLLLLGALILCGLDANAQWNGDGYYFIQNTGTTNVQKKNRYICIVGHTWEGIKSLIGGEDGDVFKQCVKMMYPDDENRHTDPGMVIRVRNLGGNQTLDAQGIGTRGITGMDVTIRNNNDGTYTPYVPAFLISAYLQDFYGFDGSMKDNRACDSYWIKPLTATSEEYFGVAPQNNFGYYYYTTLHVAFNYVLPDGVTAYVVTDENGTLSKYANAGEIVPAGQTVILQCKGSTAKENRLVPTLSDAKAAQTCSLYSGSGSNSAYFHYVENYFTNNNTAVQVNQGDAFTTSNANYRMLGIKDGKLGFYQTYKEWAAATNSNISCIDGNQCYLDLAEGLTIIGNSSLSAATSTSYVGDPIAVTVSRPTDMKTGTLYYSIDGGKTWQQTTDAKATISLNPDEAGTVTVQTYMDNGGVQSDITSATYNFLASPTLKEVKQSTTLTDGSTVRIHNNNLTCVYIDPEKKFAVAKDDNGSATDKEQPATDNNDYMGNKDSEHYFGEWSSYDQSNWVLLDLSNLTLDNTAAGLKNQRINGVKGTLSKTPGYPTIILTQVPTAVEANEYTPNTFIAANFAGTQTVKDTTYFFMKPKNWELAEITWAAWDATNKCFKVPSIAKGFAGSFEVNWSLNNGITTDDEMTTFDAQNQASKSLKEPGYTFLALVQQPGSNSKVIRRSDNGGTIVSSTVVYPLNLSSSSVVTAVSDVRAAKAVQSVRYYNVAGQMSPLPFEGLNIKVTRYTDGTQSATKLVR